MSFTEAIKLQVKRQAAFQCCRCHYIGVEVHHILPQAEDGPNNIDNAAPLCANCHSGFGGNPEKRKEIRQMRDWWYDVVKEKYTISSHVERVNEEILLLQNKSNATDAQITKLKKSIDDLKKQSEIKESDNIQTIKEKTTQFISATALASGIHTNFHCRKCNTHIGLLIGSNQCPTCKEPF